MRQSNIKTPMVFKIGVLLLCAMLITSCMMSGLYARYTVTATASDSARVARFTFTDSDMSTKVKDIQITPSVYPGQTVCSMTAVITNDSEVAIQCVLKFDNVTCNLPITDAVASSIVLAPGTTDNINFNIPWPAENNDPKFVGMMDIIRITVSVEQVD